jgi:S-DNA-T family DNA segregation ATPase FtsK/SpoIIIE
VAAALPPGKPKAWSEDVVARLSELRPEVYGRWSPEQLAAALKPYGVRTVQVWGTTEDGKGANRRGVRRTDITAAVARRDDGGAAA